MMVSIFVRRLKPGFRFEDFIREWEADVGFGVPTRVFNGPALDDPSTVVSIGFVAATADDALPQHHPLMPRSALLAVADHPKYACSVD